MSKEILIISGHGAKDPGACSSFGIEEIETRRVAEAILKELKGKAYGENATDDDISEFYRYRSAANRRRVDELAKAYLNDKGLIRDNDYVNDWRFFNTQGLDPNTVRRLNEYTERRGAMPIENPDPNQQLAMLLDDETNEKVIKAFNQAHPLSELPDDDRHRDRTPEILQFVSELKKNPGGYTGLFGGVTPDYVYNLASKFSLPESDGWIKSVHRVARDLETANVYEATFKKDYKDYLRSTKNPLSLEDFVLTALKTPAQVAQYKAGLALRKNANWHNMSVEDVLWEYASTIDDDILNNDYFRKNRDTISNILAQTNGVIPEELSLLLIDALMGDEDAGIPSKFDTMFKNQHGDIVIRSGNVLGTSFDKSWGSQLPKVRNDNYKYEEENLRRLGQSNQESVRQGYFLSEGGNLLNKATAGLPVGVGDLERANNNLLEKETQEWQKEYEDIQSKANERGFIREYVDAISTEAIEAYEKEAKAEEVKKAARIAAIKGENAKEEAEAPKAAKKTAAKKTS
ncbi:MAG: hypothetical protein HUJ56_01490, partial [Erysipelotrichaceae bacterium]|nr:hypothetical protein [Erysipelotrichaceae bacterium]